MSIRILKVRNREFLAFNVLLHTKSEQKVIDNCFCAPKIFKDPLKTGFSVRHTLLQSSSRIFYNLWWVVWIVIGCFLFEKQTFSGLLKVIGIQITFQFQQFHISNIYLRLIFGLGNSII